MKPRELLDILIVAERLKDVTRHCYTSKGRHESVAEHCWMMTLMAMFLREEFPDVDMDKVIEMCIIHDLGESFTGDIPAFDKNPDHRLLEQQRLESWIETFPEPAKSQFRGLLAEMNELTTDEARLYKALDNLEAVIQHNESDTDITSPFLICRGKWHPLLLKRCQSS